MILLSIIWGILIILFVIYLIGIGTVIDYYLTKFIYTTRVIKRIIDKKHKTYVTKLESQDIPIPKQCEDCAYYYKICDEYMCLLGGWQTSGCYKCDNMRISRKSYNRIINSKLEKQKQDDCNFGY